MVKAEKLTQVSVGFFISAFVFYILNLLFPVPDMDEMDHVDLYGTFTEAEARRVGVPPLDESHSLGVATRQRSKDNDVISGEKDVEVGVAH